MSAKQAIVSLATKHGNYVKGLARLEESLKNNFEGEFFGFINESSVGAPKHADNPYAFKVYAIEKVREQGFTQILWLDSSVFAIKNVQPVFDVIESEGYIMQEAGHRVGEWCNDATLEYFDITRNQAMEMLMYGNAGFLGLNLESQPAHEFYFRWRHAMSAGMFKGSWDNAFCTESIDDRCKGHRHDMSCGSIIANQLGMIYKSGNEWLQYAGPYDATANDTIIFKAQGV